MTPIFRSSSGHPIPHRLIIWIKTSQHHVMKWTCFLHGRYNSLMTVYCDRLLHGGRWKGNSISPVCSELRASFSSFICQDIFSDFNIFCPENTGQLTWVVRFSLFPLWHMGDLIVFLGLFCYNFQCFYKF